MDPLNSHNIDPVQKMPSLPKPAYKLPEKAVTKPGDESFFHGKDKLSLARGVNSTAAKNLAAEMAQDFKKMSYAQRKKYGVEKVDMTKPWKIRADAAKRIKELELPSKKSGWLLKNRLSKGSKFDRQEHTEIWRDKQHPGQGKLQKDLIKERFWDKELRKE